jgi:FMNH2-dependent dimethyl sulfone monooxygenase
MAAEEFVAVMHGMWTKPSFSFKGQFFEVDGAQLLLKPATAKPPEIYAASRSPRGLEMVARVGDWWFLDFDRNAQSVAALEDSLRRSIDKMEKLTAKVGRKVRYAFNPFILLGATREAAIAEAAGILAPDDASSDAARVNPRVRPAAMSGCVGTPEEVRAQIRRYEDMGIELLLFRFPPSVARVEAIHREVIAPMRGAGGTPP